MTIADYFAYEHDIARDHLVPWLRRHDALPTQGTVFDVGCGYGGTLAAIKEAAPDLDASGIDLDREMIQAGTARLGGAARLFQGDFFTWSAPPYDLMLMRDVLEHIRRPEAALAHARSLLAPGGHLFVSFAPFFGPFGGHQHNAEGPLSHVPWLQLLPNTLFRAALSVRGNSYKGESELQQDMESVLATRLTLRRFLAGAARAGLRVIAQSSYLSRPDYRIKLGLPTVALPRLGGGEELLATGIEALLRVGGA